MNMSATFAKDFAKARPVAQHCGELLRPPPVADHSADAAGWRRELANALALECDQLFANGKLRVTVSEPQTMTANAVFEKIGPVAANSLLRCDLSGEPVLLTLDLATATALTDFSFGGDGALPDEEPAQLTGAAAMLVEQFAQLVAQAIAVAGGDADTMRGEVLVRSENVARLKPFAAEAPVAFTRISLSTRPDTEWVVHLAFAEEGFVKLLPGTAAPEPANTQAGSSHDAQHGAFAELPVPLVAVLGVFDLSVKRLDRLTVGDEIPLSIPAELPLRAGEEVLAYGRLGTIENRMALRLTRMEGQTTALQFSLTSDEVAA